MHEEYLKHTKGDSSSLGQIILRSCISMCMSQYRSIWSKLEIKDRNSKTLKLSSCNQNQQNPAKDSFKKIGDIEELGIIECVGPDQEQTITTTNMTVETMGSTDPWMLFLYALKAPATRDKYIQRLTKFLDFLGYTGTKEEKARAFATKARVDPVYAFN